MTTAPPDPDELLRRGLAALERGAPEARRELEAAFEAALARRDRACEARALGGLGLLHCGGGESVEALLCAERAVAVARECGDLLALGETLAAQAEVRRRAGNAAGAHEAARAAARAFDQAALALRRRSEEAAWAAAGRASELREALLEQGPAAAGPGYAQRSREAGVDRERRARGERAQERLLQVAAQLLREPEPARLVRAVLDGAVQAVRAERGFVLLSGATEDEGPVEGLGDLAVAAARNFDQREVRQPRFKVSRTVIQRALASGEPVLVRDAACDLGDASSVAAQGLRSIACVPFASPRQGGLRGVLYLDNRFGEGAFAEEDLPALGAFAAHAALALENAQLARAAEQERRALLRERQALVEARARAEDLSRRLQQALARSGDEVAALHTRLERSGPASGARSSGPGGIVGSSPAMQAVFRLIDKVKDHDVPVVIQGESGTGKELVARAIHFQGRRREAPFVGESCAAIPATLLESELFGHVAGAFTGASGAKPGLFQAAHGGTLFLDEVGELSLEAQAKLLRALEERRVRPVGASEPVAVDVRVVAATHRDLQAMVKAGEFREDLLFRLNVVSIRLPALRERREDLPLLLHHLLAVHCGPAAPEVPAELLRALLAHDWPGNVRELDNEVRRLVALGQGQLRLRDLSPAVVAPRQPGDLAPARPQTLEAAQREAVLSALRASDGSKARAAELLGIPRSSLYHWLQRLGLEAP